MSRRIVTACLAVTAASALLSGLTVGTADAASSNKAKAIAAAKKWCGKGYLLQHDEDVKAIRTKKAKTIGYEVVLLGEINDSTMSVKVCQVSRSNAATAKPRHDVTILVMQGGKLVKKPKTDDRTTGVLGLKTVQPWGTVRAYKTSQQNAKYGTGTATVTIRWED